MKNKIKLLSLIGLFALGACSGGAKPKTTPTYGGKTPEPDSSQTPTAAPSVTPTEAGLIEWTDEEIDELIAAHRRKKRE